MRCYSSRQRQNRRLNQRFKELKAWYLFETRFCNIAKGNEKGDVENLYKRSERTYLSPQPQVDGIDQMASKLFDECQNDFNRKGPDVHGGKTLGELLVEEKSCFLLLESERFEVSRRRSTFVDSHSLVHVGTVRYSVPVQWAYHPCVIKMFSIVLPKEFFSLCFDWERFLHILSWSVMIAREFVVAQKRNPGKL